MSLHTRRLLIANTTSIPAGMLFSIVSVYFQGRIQVGTFKNLSSPLTLLNSILEILKYYTFFELMIVVQTTITTKRLTNF